jgi:hypothetical protein
MLVEAYLFIGNQGAFARSVLCKTVGYMRVANGILEVISGLTNVAPIVSQQPSCVAGSTMASSCGALRDALRENRVTHIVV